MLQPAELRIGNWIGMRGIPTSILLEDSEFLPTRVDLETIKDIDALSDFEYSAIPLTPEILEKAGFEKADNGIALKTFEGYVWIGSLFEGFPLTLEIDGNRMPLHHIKHVHQLQNLYFALTGEEIKIEL